MASKGHRLSNQLLGLQTPKKVQQQTLPQLLNLDQVISLHRNVIQKLQDEIKYLRQYLKYCIGQKDNQSQNDTDSSLQKENKNGQNNNLKSKKKSGARQILRQIMVLLEVQDIEHLIGKLTGVLEKANKKIEPVFVERIKYKEVPVPIEIIKQVVRYVEKEVVVQKRVQVPIFRQKIVYRYADKPVQANTAQQKNNFQENFKQEQKKALLQLPKESKQLITARKAMQNQVKGNKFEKTKNIKLSIDINSPSNCSDVVSPRNRQQNDDFTKKKQFFESPKHNQTLGYHNGVNGNVKSPRFRQKESDNNHDSQCNDDQYRDKQYRNDKNYKSPRYRAKGNHF